MDFYACRNCIKEYKKYMNIFLRAFFDKDNIIKK